MEVVYIRCRIDHTRMKIVLARLKTVFVSKKLVLTAQKWFTAIKCLNMFETICNGIL